MRSPASSSSYKALASELALRLGMLTYDEAFLMMDPKRTCRARKPS